MYPQDHEKYTKNQLLGAAQMYGLTAVKHCFFRFWPPLDWCLFFSLFLKNFGKLQECYALCFSFFVGALFYTLWRGPDMPNLAITAVTP